MMVWLFFANLFDPAKVATVERVADPTQGADTQRRAATGAGRPR